MAAKQPPLNSEKAYLLKVSEEFTQWRGRRTQGRSKIPEHLRHQAISLLSHHPKSRVTRALGITGDMLNRWQNHQPTEGDGEPLFDVISLNPSHEETAVHQAAVDLVLTVNAQHSIRVQGPLSLAQLTALMRGVLPESGVAP